MAERIVVVVGPTAAGKTEVGAELARRLGGEVVSADAFAVYRGMDIGTAKPSPELRASVPHHLIDVADPSGRYSAGDFVRDADAAIAEIRSRGRVVVVVGGTHFYVRALLWGLFPEPRKDPALRAELEAAWQRSPAAVRARLAAVDPASAARLMPADRQRILRALEVAIVAGRPMSELWNEAPRHRPRHTFVMLGLGPERPVLHARIASRMKKMFRAGLLAEVGGLLARGVSADAHALKAIGYRECCRVLAGEWSEEQAEEASVVATRRLAKRQLTWLRAEPELEWLGAEGVEAVERALVRVEVSGGSAGSGQVEDQR